MRAVLFQENLAACAVPSPPVPVVGAPSDVAQLAGEWEGQYSSVETGRRGSIFFHIAAGTDSFWQMARASWSTWDFIPNTPRPKPTTRSMRYVTSELGIGSWRNLP